MIAGRQRQRAELLRSRCAGHRLYSESFLQTLQETFHADDSADQSNAGRIESFLNHSLNYEPLHFDGVLIWDLLEYLDPTLLAAVVERLHKIVRPKSYMLAFFHSDAKLEAVPHYTFRIQEVNLLHVTQQGSRNPAQPCRFADVVKVCVRRGGKASRSASEGRPGSIRALPSPKRRHSATPPKPHLCI